MDNKAFIKKYWGYFYRSIIVLLVIAITFVISYSTVGFVFVVISWGYDLYRFGGNMGEINQLKEKGFTEDDAINTVFVKKWEQTRAEGKVSYCLLDGAIVQGGIFALFLCLIAIAVFGMQTLFAELSGMFLLIGGAYLIGGFITSLFYHFRWKQNEERFKRLTQFEHLIL